MDELYPPAGAATTSRMWAEIARAAYRHRSIAQSEDPGSTRVPWPSTPKAVYAYQFLQAQIRIAHRSGVESSEILDAVLAGDRTVFTVDEARVVICDARRAP